MTVSAIRTDFDMNYVSDLFSRIQYSIKEEQIPFFYLGQMHMDEKEKLFLHGNTTHKQTDRQTHAHTQRQLISLLDSFPICLNTEVHLMAFRVPERYAIKLYQLWLINFLIHLFILMKMAEC